MISYKTRRNLMYSLLHILLITLVVVYMLPVVMTLMYSFKTDREMLSTKPLQLPVAFSFENYGLAMERLSFFRTLFNTLFITVATVALTILFSSLSAYGIARGTKKRFTVLYLLFVGGLLIPYQAVFVPIYLIGSKLNMLNSYWGIIFFYLGGQMPFSVFMLTGFMKTIPVDIEQAAVIDGCNIFAIYWHIILPLLKPAAVTLSVMRALSIWNDFLMPRLFLQDQSMMTLTVRIANLFGQYRYRMNLAFAAIILSSLPILIFFVFNQKNIERGIAAGAVKG